MAALGNSALQCLSVEPTGLVPSMPLQDAFKSGEKETLLYVPAIVPDQSRPDYLAVIDVDPDSETYQQV